MSVIQAAFSLSLTLRRLEQRSASSSLVPSTPGGWERPRCHGVDGRWAFASQSASTPTVFTPSGAKSSRGVDPSRTHPYCCVRLAPSSSLIKTSPSRHVFHDARF